MGFRKDAGAWLGRKNCLVMDTAELKRRLSGLGIIPVVTLEDANAALPLGEAIAQAGLPVVEITFRTPAAAEAIRLLSRQQGDILVGAGTVLSVDTLKAAQDAGAQFAVAPGLNPAVVRSAQELGVPFIPGVATPSEVERALFLGCTLVKFFPAEALGGVEMLSALSAPYRHLGLRFIPTGGLDATNFDSYLRCEAVAAVGGTWLAPRADLAAGNWEQICQRCREVVEKAREILRQVKMKER